MENCTPIESCLACGCHNLVATLDLGIQPLANNFRPDQSTVDEPCFPLAINRCNECNHLQLTHAVDPRLIYTHYLYVSGTSKTNKDYMEWFAHFVREQFTYWPSSVLDIGCNDGTQLDAFKRVQFQTFGVDPAENLYELSNANHHVVCDFWNKSAAGSFGQKFDAIVTQNSFAHIPDPLSYLQLAKKYLAPQGRMFIQTSQSNMVLHGEFDTIYHEHISFYNAESMRRLAERAGLYLQDIVKTPIHGTSYVFILGHDNRQQHRIQNILDLEAARGLQTAQTYQDWAAGVYDLLDRLKNQIDEFRGFGFDHIIGYGAAAKGMTLLNASKLHLDAVVDDNALKQGLYCPGTDIPVVSQDYIKQIPADEKIIFVPLAWNFYPEIVQKIRAIRDTGEDGFVRYFPNITTDFYG